MCVFLKLNKVVVAIKKKFKKLLLLTIGTADDVTAGFLSGSG